MSAKLTRRERERQRYRREILTVALNLFSRKGFEKTTMAQIAEQAEFAVGTLYKFFEDKETLYRALILDTMRDFERELSAALKAPGTGVRRVCLITSANVSIADLDMPPSPQPHRSPATQH